ncbi:unnamed protein product [Gongylonema pulchrum]|uniref:BEACH domain-containing protein n=1 Tax=Gongylonema pulchrum TaxID=637853 RepID=A0A183D611_9BILA|nr:unnamed protein product [Gongylonema pulchrum]
MTKEIEENPEVTGVLEPSTNDETEKEVKQIEEDEERENAEVGFCSYGSKQHLFRLKPLGNVVKSNLDFQHTACTSGSQMTAVSGTSTMFGRAVVPETAIVMEKC